MVIPVNTLPKSASLGSLGLLRGDHWVRFHVEEESISFELEPPSDEMEESAPARKSTSFVQRWGGTARKIADETDPWLPTSTRSICGDAMRLLLDPNISS